MRRHASADEMASYVAGDMRPRKAAKIAAHLDGCAGCRQLIAELEGVSGLLASVSVAYEPMPENLSARIEAAIATESVHRVASEPATEAGRRDLPTRARRSRKVSWRLPGISSGALRTVAATAAALVVAGGIYELASQGAGPSSAPSSAAHGLPAHAGAAPAKLGPRATPHAQQSFGPDVTLTYGRHEVNLRTASASTNFVPGHLQAQVTTAVTVATNDGLIAPNHQAPGASASSAAPVLNSPSEAATAHRLAGCIERVAGPVVPELVELARFKGMRATVIVFAAAASHPARVLVVGARCSATASDLLDRQVLKHV